MNVLIRAFAPLLLVCTLLAPHAHAASPEELAEQVVIHRDEYGVPHIHGETNEAMAFGFGYTQAEDFFWQVEESYLMAIGRYAELKGEEGVSNDLLNRNFEINRRAKEDMKTQGETMLSISRGFAAGINYFLKTHPEVKPRVLTQWEPWYLAAFERHIILDQLLYGYVPIGKGKNVELLEEWRSHIGSNAWAISPQKTKSGAAMLLANPHQPHFGAGQFTEAHLRSDEGYNVSGATFWGSPIISIGHNAHLGWSHTVNEPNVGDAWIVTFDDADNPLHYRYDGGHRLAEEWTDTIKVKTRKGLEEREYKFRKTHHGPIAGKVNGSDNKFYAVKVANLFEGKRALQWFKMGMAKNFDEFKEALSMLGVNMFNTIYADDEGNILYLYGGAIPKRDPKFDWFKPVDGSTPDTEWQGIHPWTDLPQVINPISGYVQNCNTSPYTTTDDGNPFRKDFPEYMLKDGTDDKRRAKMSRYLLRNMQDVTFEEWQDAAFDTTMYWPMNELHKYADLLESIKDTEPEVYKEIKPYMDHLTDGWDFRATHDSTQATLLVDWYDQLYEGMYPKEHFKKQFKADKVARLKALGAAADNLKKRYGDWKVPYGQLHRMQRVANVGFGAASDVMKLKFRDNEPHAKMTGVPGPLGVAYTMYYAPPLFGFKNRYSVVGSSFMGSYSFEKDGVKAKTLLNFGQSGNPDSPHFMDQAKLWEEMKFKDAWYHWDDVEANTKRKYKPGEDAK